MKTTITVHFLIFLLFSGVFAQIPPGYYDPADGKTGETLQQALHDIVQTPISLSYNSLWGYFHSTDARPDSTVWDIYSDKDGTQPPYSYLFGVDQCGSSGAGPSEGICYDREHSWPKSWFGGEVYPMYTDLFIIYPVDSYVNTRRSNYPYGPVADPQWTSLNGSKLGYCSLADYNGKVFEPIDEFKGDLARSYFYFSIRYYHDDESWPGSSMTDGSQMKLWALHMMQKWNSQDPVSQKETDRNNAVYRIQGNRNPFIDHPEYAGMIWGYGSGIPEEDGTKLRVFPNPAHEHCFLSLDDGFNHLSSVNILSLTGIVIRINTLNKDNGLLLDVHDLVPGAYFVTAFGSGNAEYYHGKILKY